VLRTLATSWMACERRIVIGHEWSVSAADALGLPPSKRQQGITIRQPGIGYGEPTSVAIEEQPRRAGANHVVYDPGQLIIFVSPASATPAAKSLENWLRKRARMEIVTHLDAVTTKLNRQPDKVLIMGQRTKWGNCSPLKNLSFNWRLVMAPDFVLRYLVTHEAVHFAIPDHSRKF
jgi:predicted metal-dependent hydrolase